MGIVQSVLIVLVCLVVLYLIVGWFFKTSTQLTSMSDGKTPLVIPSSSLPSNNNTSNYTYSTWFYVDDWNYRFGEPKTILGRLDADKHPSPSIGLGAIENDLQISVSCYSQDPATGSAGSTPIVHKCSVRNVPLQKWVNLIISLYGRTLDVYIDGKLVRTCVLPGVAQVNPDADILVTPMGGFSGWTSNFQYWAAATNPQQAYNIYKSGYGGNALGNLFNKYRVKVSFLEDNKEQGSFEI
jgi:hypothetical protein